jgi:hypothetical protein
MAGHNGIALGPKLDDADGQHGRVGSLGISAW